MNAGADWLGPDRRELAEDQAEWDAEYTLEIEANRAAHFGPSWRTGGDWSIGGSR